MLEVKTARGWMAAQRSNMSNITVDRSGSISVKKTHYILGLSPVGEIKPKLGYDGSHRFHHTLIRRAG
jgi:hypothetical protein